MMLGFAALYPTYGLPNLRARGFHRPVAYAMARLIHPARNLALPISR